MCSLPRGSTVARATLELESRPGLYRITATAQGLQATTTGFWVFDPQLFASGDTLVVDHYTLLRNGRPEPVVGTSLMSGAIRAEFLFEPNAGVWDDTFADLATLKINLVRTGVWSGWRKIAAEPGAVDEAWLRALEAFYLTARKHGIPVLFTFFAFLPESFGGENAYLDPAGGGGPTGIHFSGGRAACSREGNPLGPDQRTVVLFRQAPVAVQTQWRRVRGEGLRQVASRPDSVRSPRGRKALQHARFRRRRTKVGRPWFAPDGGWLRMTRSVCRLTRTLTIARFSRNAAPMAPRTMSSSPKRPSSHGPPKWSRAFERRARPRRSLSAGWTAPAAQSSLPSFSGGFHFDAHLVVQRRTAVGRVGGQSRG